MDLVDRHCNPFAGWFKNEDFDHVLAVARQPFGRFGDRFGSGYAACNPAALFVLAGNWAFVVVVSRRVRSRSPSGTWMV
jgi:hypothetical protein